MPDVEKVIDANDVHRDRRCTVMESTANFQNRDVAQDSHADFNETPRVNADSGQIVQGS